MKDYELLCIGDVQHAIVGVNLASKMTGTDLAERIGFVKALISVAAVFGIAPDDVVMPDDLQLITRRNPIAAQTQRWTPAILKPNDDR